MLKRFVRLHVVWIIGLGALASLVAGRGLYPTQIPPDRPISDRPAGQDTVSPDQAARLVEVVRERYANGKVKIRREVTRDALGNYVLHGGWAMWDQEGNQIASGRYRNNRRDGTWTRLHLRSDSELFASMPYKEFQAPFRSQASFDQGQLSGKWIITDWQHRKVSQWEYVHGARHGVSTWRYPSGRLMRRAVYCNGLLDGPSQSWDRQSHLIATEQYQDGRKLVSKVEYYDSGQKKSEGMYLSAALVVDAADDWWNAKPATYVRTGGDQLHGRWTSWYANQRKNLEGSFQYGLRDGRFMWWYSNGQPKVAGRYSSGRPDSLWVWWHKNGQRAAEGQYVDGRPSGPWCRWQEDGQLCRKIDYSWDSNVVVASAESTDPASADPSARRLPPPTQTAAEPRER